MNKALKQPIYGLVIDKHGNPKFDDWDHIPKPLWEAMTPAQQAYCKQKRQEKHTHGADPA